MKCLFIYLIDKRNESLPPRGAWIEILIALKISEMAMSLPPRGAWIEMVKDLVKS